MKHLSELIRILDDAEIISASSQPERFFDGALYLNDSGDYEIFFIKPKDRNIYSECFRYFYDHKKEIAKTYSRKNFNEQLEELLYKLKSNQQQLKQSHIDELYKRLSNEPLLEYDIIHPVSGINFNSFINYENFMLGNYDNIRKYIDEKYMDIDANTQNFIARSKGEMKEYASFIVVKTNARDADKARELAYDKMKDIEAVLRFFASIYNKELCDIGILDFKSCKVDKSFILTDELKQRSSSISGARIELNWSDFHKRCNSYIEPLLKIISKPEKDITDIEKRIILAVNFCSRAIYDRENVVGFLEAMMAIEALLQMNSDALISPSITYQIAEYCSFLLHTTSDGRKNINKVMHKLYKIRSKISHGKTEKFSKEDFEQLWDIAITLILKFLSDEDLKKMQEDSELKEYIDNLRYT